MKKETDSSQIKKWTTSEKYNAFLLENPNGELYVGLSRQGMRTAYLSEADIRRIIAEIKNKKEQVKP